MDTKLGWQARGRLAGRARRGAVLVLGAAVLAVGGCGDDDAASRPERVGPVTLEPGAPVPVPDEPVLTVSGPIEGTNAGDELVLDLAAIESLGLVAFELDEPFQEQRMGFRGVHLADVVALAEPVASAGTLHTIALNDYTADVPLDIATGPGTMLATRKADGSAIDVAEGGPIRIVFLEGAAGGDVHDYWTWSLARIEVG